MSELSNENIISWNRIIPKYLLLVWLTKYEIIQRRTFPLAPFYFYERIHSIGIFPALKLCRTNVLKIDWDKIRLSGKPKLSHSVYNKRLSDFAHIFEDVSGRLLENFKQRFNEFSDLLEEWNSFLLVLSYLRDFFKNSGLKKVSYCICSMNCI